MLLAEADVRVPPDALREDARLLDRRRVVQVVDNDQRTDGKPPGPPRALRVVLRLADDFHHAEDRLPDGCVEDRRVAALHGRALRRGVRADLPGVDVGAERLLAAPANEQPVRQTRSMIPANAWPKPMHIVAIP